MHEVSLWESGFDVPNQSVQVGLLDSPEFDLQVVASTWCPGVELIPLVISICLKLCLEGCQPWPIMLSEGS